MAPWCSPVLLSLAVLARCAGQTVSPTASPSPACAAPPGSYCSSGGSVLACPAGAFCAGGEALNVSCYPVAACSVPGLRAQPPCYWNVTTLAGRATTGFTNGAGTAASFNGAFGLLPLQNGSLLIVDEFNGALRALTNGVVSTVLTGLGAPCFAVAGANGTLYVSESAGPSRVSAVSPSGAVSAFVGSAAVGAANGIGTSAQFTGPVQLAFNQSADSLLLADYATRTLRSIAVATRAVATAAGSGAAGSATGPALAASFSRPYGVAVNASGAVFIADNGNDNIRVLLAGVVSAYAGGGASIEGPRASVVVTAPESLALDALGNLLVPSNNRVRLISPSGAVRTLAGSGAAAVADGFGTAAAFSAVRAIGVAPSGALFATDNDGSYIRQLTCVPCPASYFCASGVPVLCPAGSACPLSSVNATLCPKGSFAPAGASSCTPCPAGTLAPAAGASACQQCPGGHYCPAGASSWARLNCGRGSYCPGGSGAPAPCPLQAPPAGGWGALQVQGPAFLVETAQCLNHCFWNFTSGDGALSKC